MGNTAIAKKTGTVRKAKSHFFLEKPTSDLPNIPTALHTRELFKKSDQAVERLKNQRNGIFQ